MNIVVPAYVNNPTAYIAATKAHIMRNAAKTKREKFFAETPDGQRLYDWLNQCGEFRSTPVTQDPKDQAEFDRLSPMEDYRDQDDLEYRLNVRYVPHEMTVGMFSGSFGDTLMGLRGSFREYGQWSPKQTKLIRDAFARKEKWVAEAAAKRAQAAERDAGSVHVGEIKQRITMNLHIRNVLSFDGDYGMAYLNIMNDDDGNVIVGKGTKRYGDDGSTVTATVTVIKHEVRDGINQTVVNRPTFKK